MQPLATWIEQAYHYAGRAMLASVSAVGIIKERPGFGQRIVPKPGSVVASAVLASYDPDPDYFFHWYRDSAIVLDALRVLHGERASSADALTQLTDFVGFSLALSRLDGRELVSSASWRSSVKQDFARFLRTDVELATVHGESVLAETRVNADGTLDISSWPRPQNDGPATRVLTVLRWARVARPDPSAAQALATLVREDLAYVRQHATEPGFDIWEEEQGWHYYTLRVSAAALAAGADWYAANGEPREARACRDLSLELMRRLDGYWLAKEGHYRSRVLANDARTPKELDIAVILAVVHTADEAPSHDPSRPPAAHGVSDPRVHATLDRLSELFTIEYEINHGRPAERAPAMGRYPGDTYYSGGAYYFSTLGAAELCYRAACAAGAECEWVKRGDAYLETVRAFTPASYELSEQFDRRTGAQTSARHLAWSYAALITCVAARRAAVARAKT